MATYFTSDLHLGHTAILEYESRPWNTIEEHDAAIIEQINDTVGRDDELFILGDFTMRLRPTIVQDYLDAIECRNRWLIMGNHDKSDALFEPGGFVECSHYKELLIDGTLCCLSHYPMLDWNMSKAHHGVPPNEASLMCTAMSTAMHRSSTMHASAQEPGATMWESTRMVIGRSVSRKSAIS